MFPIKQVLKPICPAKEVSWTELLPRLFVRYSSSLAGPSQIHRYQPPEFEKNFNAQISLLQQVIRGEKIFREIIH
jgi:hypothetical protein